MNNFNGFDSDSFESLMIALIQLRDKDGRVYNLTPEDVFQPWFLEEVRKLLPKFGD